MLIERLQPFIRLLWFACRGNVLVRYSTVEQSLEDPLTVRYFFYSGIRLVTSLIYIPLMIDIKYVNINFRPRQYGKLSLWFSSKVNSFDRE
jgi:hypothetical protein